MYLKTIAKEFTGIEYLIDEHLAKFDKSIKDLFTAPFRWQDLTDFLTALIVIAEDMFPDPGSGSDKIKFVMEVWEHYDTKYHLVDKVDGLVDFTKILGSALGTVVEKFDGKAIRVIVEKVIIPLLVSKIFPHV